MFMYFDNFKTQCINYRPDLYNLQTRKKSDKKQIELSINNNTKRSQI